MNNKYTEGCYQLEDGRYRLYEDVSINSSTIVEKQKMTEQLTETVNNKNLKVYGIYTIKLWSVDPNDRNKNGRNYSRVANKVIKENKVTVGLMNHPEKGAGDPKDIFAVEKNPRIIEDYLCVDIHLVGDYGNLCESILEAGGPLEFSSSALGDCQNGFVLEEGFEIERFADRVFCPSNSLSLFKSDTKNQTESNVDPVPMLTETELNNPESTKKEINENITILDKDTNNNGEKIMSDKLMETSIALNIRGMIKEAKKEESFTEKKRILENARDIADELTDKSLKESIDKEIEVTNKEIADLAEKGKTVDDLNTNVKSLNETIENLKKEKIEETEKLAKELEETKKAKEELEATHKTLVEMYENKEYEAGESIVNTNKALNKSITLLRNRIKSLTEKVNYLEALANTKVDADLVVTLKEANDKLSLKNRILERSKKVVDNAKVINEFKNPDVKDYFDTLLEKDSSIEKYRNKFLDCNSVAEAQIKYLHLDESYIPKESTVRTRVLHEDTNKTEKKEVSALAKSLAEKGLF